MWQNISSKKTPIGHLGKSLENLRSVVGEEVMDQTDVKKKFITTEKPIYLL